MPGIHKKVLIQAGPEAVFDLITRVEEFPNYSNIIEEVKLIAANTYRWTVRVGGLSLDWDAEITDFVRPERFGWRAIRGIHNSGTYHLTPIDHGTTVSFTMEYRLQHHALERVIAPLVEPLIQRVSAEILHAVKARLETEK